LHLRPASRIVQLARSFQSSISLRIGQRVANARSMLAMLLLSATVGTVVDLEISGVDEDQALLAMTSVFESADVDVSEPGAAPGGDEVGVSQPK